MVEDLDEGSAGDAQLQCGRDQSRQVPIPLRPHAGGGRPEWDVEKTRAVIARHRRTSCQGSGYSFAQSLACVAHRCFALPLLCLLSWLPYTRRVSLPSRNAHPTRRTSPRCLPVLRITFRLCRWSPMIPHRTQSLVRVLTRHCFRFTQRYTWYRPREACQDHDLEVTSRRSSPG